MRYFLLCLAAFVLFAVPAFAENTLPVTVDVTVKIVDLYWFDFTAPDVLFEPNATDMNNGKMFKDNAFTGDVRTNVIWKLYAAVPAYTGSLAGLVLSLERDDADTDPGTGWIAVGTIPTLITTDGPGTDLPKLDLQLSGLLWTMNGTQAQTMAFTFSTT